MQKKLDDIDKKLKFDVPERYFEDLPMKIQKRVESENRKNYSLKVPSWSLAMTAAVAVIVGFLFVWNGSDSSVEDLLAEIPDDDLIAYIEELNLDTYDLAAAFPESSEEIEFEDVEMMEGLEIEDLSIDDILLEYDIEEEKLEI